MTTMSPTLEEFDIIFAGGGTTASFIAGRLAKADPSLKILLVEAGPLTENNLSIIQPARFLTNLQPDSPEMTFHVGNPEEQLGDRQVTISVAHCVGGGSSVNFMMYSRSSASDYDDWEGHGNPGWGSKDLIPLMKKTETYEVEPGHESVHGYSGPLKVSYGGLYSNVGKEFLEITARYNPRGGVTKDANDFSVSSIDKYARWAKWISSNSGRRQDVPHAVIYDKGLKNVTLLVGHLVKRVIFKGKRAVGIEYVEDPRVHASASGAIHTARARRIVVVSSGAFGSPGILERSGIGAKSVLDRYGVKQIVDLPGVGEHYLDHQIIFSPYLAKEDTVTIDPIVRHEEPVYSDAQRQWRENGTGLLATNAIDAAIKIRPTPKERKEIGPNFEERWKTVFANAPDKPIAIIMPLCMFVGDIETSPSRKYFTIAYFLSHPSARGYIHIKDGNDPTVHPEFKTGFLTPDDLALMVWLYKHTREYARRMPCYRGEYVPSHPKFAKTSPALCKGEIPPVAVGAPDIPYTKEDDKDIEEFMRKEISGCWHSLGTCAMKPQKQGGVVDPRLNVYGVEGLKVADMSICPSNLSANTYSTATAIAEKAALLIAEELGICGV